MKRNVNSVVNTIMEDIAIVVEQRREKNMDEVEYQQQFDNFVPAQMPQSAGMSPDLVRWQLSGVEILDDVEHKLKGECWTIIEKQNKGVWLKKYKPLLNDDGVNSVMSMMSNILTQNTFLSDLDEEDIHKMTSNFIISFIYSLDQNFMKWEVDIANIDLLVEILDFTIYTALRRARKGATMNFLMTTQKIIQQRIDRPEFQQREKIPSFSLFNMLGKKG